MPLRAIQIESVKAVLDGGLCEVFVSGDDKPHYIVPDGEPISKGIFNVVDVDSDRFPTIAAEGRIHRIDR